MTRCVLALCDTDPVMTRIDGVAVALVLVMASCGGSESSPDSATIEQVDAGTSTTIIEPAVDEPVSTTTVKGASEFCAEFNALGDSEVPESYVGSPAHLADVETLQAAAPDELVDEFKTFRDFIASGVIDTESDPESNLSDEWPSEVQEAIETIQNYGFLNC